ncbi:GNAT family N-acetyltransferase [Dictyobacter aurantiacus]|uniref:N-acetyltransferase n=1 Tax=Dictyobacter aurantiacus TaxID=1936993 RepID=A0A401ZJE0_9CHLR|nr:GNAT family N-acetyltransferase [Dictyobacter aurantiacus]GCE06977.1 N-acetyltransferase [Dictyobacter aurantiacus]
MLQLTTPRLLFLPLSLELKKVTLHDKSRLAELMDIRVPEDWPGPGYARALPFFIQLMEQDPSGAVWDGAIVRREDRTLIGDMGFKGGPNASGRVEIGYSIVPAYRRQGYASEMARALIERAFQLPTIAAVTAECDESNIASIRVLEHVGMQRQGRKDHMLLWEIQKPG